MAPAPRSQRVRDTAHRCRPLEPREPFVAYDFDAMDGIGKALREVDPGLRGGDVPTETLSAEATMVRLSNLFRPDGETVLTPVQVARFTGQEPSKGGLAIELMLFRPQFENESQEVVSAAIRQTSRTAANSSSQTITPTVSASATIGLKKDNTDTLAPSIPLLERTSAPARTPRSAPSAERFSSTVWRPPRTARESLASP
ncbi:hypothetical protein NKH18_45175 [Streptomyces sp. M10(2022)]